MEKRNPKDNSKHPTDNSKHPNDKSRHPKHKSRHPKDKSRHPKDKSKHPMTIPCTRLTNPGTRPQTISKNNQKHVFSIGFAIPHRGQTEGDVIANCDCAVQAGAESENSSISLLLRQLPGKAYRKNAEEATFQMFFHIFLVVREAALAADLITT